MNAVWWTAIGVGVAGTIGALAVWAGDRLKKAREIGTRVANELEPIEPEPKPRKPAAKPPESP